MGWRNTFILINRNANFHFVAVDLEEKFMSFCFDGKKLEVMVGNNPRKESERQILLNSKTLLHYLFHVAEDICCERSWKFLFADDGNVKARNNMHCNSRRKSTQSKEIRIKNYF